MGSHLWADYVLRYGRDVLLVYVKRHKLFLPRRLCFPIKIKLITLNFLNVIFSTNNPLILKKLLYLLPKSLLFYNLYLLIYQLRFLSTILISIRILFPSFKRVLPCFLGGQLIDSYQTQFVLDFKLVF